MDLNLSEDELTLKAVMSPLHTTPEAAPGEHHSWTLQQWRSGEPLHSLQSCPNPLAWLFSGNKKVPKQNYSIPKNTRKSQLNKQTKKNHFFRIDPGMERNRLRDILARLHDLLKHETESNLWEQYNAVNVNAIASTIISTERSYLFWDM